MQSHQIWHDNQLRGEKRKTWLTIPLSHMRGILGTPINTCTLQNNKEIIIQAIPLLICLISNGPENKQSLK